MNQCYQQTRHKKNKSWLEPELRLLQANHKTSSLSELSTLIGRSENGIKTQCQRSGFSYFTNHKKVAA